MTERDKLRERVAALEAEHAALKAAESETGSSRRAILGGLAGAGGLLVLGSDATTGTARAQAVGAIGSPESPVDVNASTVSVGSGLTGELTGGDTVTQLVGENLTVTDGRLDAPAGIDEDLEADLEEAVAELLVVGGGGNTRYVGPDEPTGSGHENPLWGIHFETDAEAYLGEKVIDSTEPGWITFAVYEYDGEEYGSLVDTRRIRTSGAKQRVLLDFQVPRASTT